MLPPGATEEAWGGMSDRGLEVHRAAHRRGRHAGGRVLHAVPHAQSLAIGMKRAVSDLKKSGRGARIHAAHRARPERQDGLRRTGRDVPVHDALYTIYAGLLSGAIVAAVVMIIWASSSPPSPATWWA